MPIQDIHTLSAQLAGAHARWQARQTPHTNLSDDDKRALLGVVVDHAALARAMAPLAGAPPVANFAPAVDWRNNNGNHVTPVKFQDRCGSCVSFCTTAVVESMASIEKGLTLDLSEADLHFCSAHGASCGGWWPDQAYAEIASRGIVSEAAFPYMRGFDEPPVIDPATNLYVPHCVAVADRAASAVKITRTGVIAGVVERKNYLSNVGPCSAVLHVFDDFYSYGGGVYHHVSGADLGLHCVEVIGYSEAQECWICKNSWGEQWGDNGTFRIAYGQAGIDGEFPFWTAQGVVPASVPAAAGDPVGYVFASAPVFEQHNLFRSADGHIQALWFNFAEGWHREDRSALVPGTPPAIDEPVAYAFVNAPTGLLEQHHLFRSADGHVHALWFNFAEGWHHENRTLIVPGTPRAVGKPFGYAFVEPNRGLLEQHNLFRSADGHIHALWFNFAGGWHHEDRSAIVRGVPPAVGNPTAYTFVGNGVVEQHNLFRSADGHIHALWFNFAGGWHHEDRSRLLPGIPPAVGEPFGYSFVNAKTGLLEQHNLFRSADGHIHALWFNFAEGWHHEDRSALLPGIPPAVGDPFGYAFVSGDGDIVEQHNLFRSADGRIHALWFNFAEGWHHEVRR